jgi:transposase InsO family protein
MPDTALVDQIRSILAASAFHGEGHRKVWARLRLAGVRTSKRRVLRLMREHGLLAPSRVGSPRGPRNHDGTIIPDTIDTLWGTDLTSVWTAEGQAAVFIAVDHCSAECVGIHAARRATRFEALEPIRQGVRRHFGGFARSIAAGLAVRHDHGSQYMADHFQTELAFLGIESSPAFVRAPEGNGGACPPAGKAGPGGRALHSHLERKPALGAELRHRRRAPSRTPRLPPDLQCLLAHRAARLQTTHHHPP